MQKLTYIFLIILSLGIYSCGSNEKEDEADDSIVETTVELSKGDPQYDISKWVTIPNAWTDATKPPTHSLHVNLIGGSLGKVFCDSNDTHYQVAEKIGIEPIYNLNQAYNLRTRLVKVYSNEYYIVDSLKYSFPFLIPKAESLLREIGMRFADTIRARGGHEYRIKVTSLLRTNCNVSKLRRRNRNASDSSVHRFGTTFDISYSKFICCDTTFLVGQADLKNILGEILNELRNNGRCYVKYERKQSCYHITVR